MHALDGLIAIVARRTPPGADEAGAQRFGQGFGQQAQTKLAAQRVGVDVAARGKARESRSSGDEGHRERSFRRLKTTEDDFRYRNGPILARLVNPAAAEREPITLAAADGWRPSLTRKGRSEEHTSELQSR